MSIQSLFKPGNNSIMEHIKHICTFPFYILGAFLFAFTTWLDGFDRNKPKQGVKTALGQTLGETDVGYIIYTRKLIIMDNDLQGIRIKSKWCRENIGIMTIDWDLSLVHQQKDYHAFVFKREEDAMAFKLVWEDAYAN